MLLTEGRETDSLYAVFHQVIRLHWIKTHTFLDKIDVYPGQPPLLFALGRRDGLSQRELAEFLHLKPATVTVMLNRMEKSGLVERRPDESDQRVSRVFITEHGRQVLDEVKGTMKDLELELFKDLTEEEQLLLRRLLMQVRSNLTEKKEE